MKLFSVAGFEWDSGNWPKCGKHGLSKAEVEAVFVNGPAVYPNLNHSLGEERFRAIGKTDAGRYVYVSFTLRDRADGTLIRPISARYMHQKEIDRYEQG